MSETQQSNLQQRVQMAFNRLPLNKGAELKLQTAVQTITLLVTDHAGRYRPSPAFQRIGRTRVTQEVEQVRLYAARCAAVPRKGQANPFQKLSAHLASLRGTTIDVLADHGVLRDGALGDPARTALLASRIHLSGISETLPGGRPANLRAQGIAKVLAWHYVQVTGKRPVVSKSEYRGGCNSPFVKLLDDVLRIAGMRADPYALALAACKVRKNR